MLIGLLSVSCGSNAGARRPEFVSPKLPIAADAYAADGHLLVTAAAPRYAGMACKASRDGRLRACTASAASGRPAGAATTLRKSVGHDARGTRHSCNSIASLRQHPTSRRPLSRWRLAIPCPAPADGQPELATQSGRHQRSARNGLHRVGAHSVKPSRAMGLTHQAESLAT